MTDHPADAPPAGGRRWLVMLPLVLFAALAGLFLVRLFAGDPSKLPSTLIGRPVPVFALPPLAGLTADGKPVPGLATADLGGTVTVVNVWASWCAPCRDEHPLLIELAKTPGVRVVGINYKDQPENARRFLGALGNPFSAVGVDTSGRAAIDWGVYGVPETFVIAPDGTIAYKHVGPLSPASMQGSFRAALTAAAAKKP
ncbi:MAG: DsbE family thiol:disulfide interchange protein [Burkholderiales bacterium]|jgi:cytochrome c biogenesis protein CcmG/thiol:disulfide interchange protein DsbE|nr:DsbE family thiol:disulfide interchange protein [Burkholderiales bacterium]